MDKKPKDAKPLTWPDAKASKRFDPGSMKIPLPFGRISRLVPVADLRFLLREQDVIPSLNERLGKLRRHRQLDSDVAAIMKLATERNVTGMEYMADWELRARLAEAELVGLHLDSNEFAKEVSKKRSSAAKLGRSQYPEEKKLVEDRCERWIRDGMHEKRGNVLRDLKKDLLRCPVSNKTIERWFDKKKAHLTD